MGNWNAKAWLCQYLSFDSFCDKVVVALLFMRENSDRADFCHRLCTLQFISKLTSDLLFRIISKLLDRSAPTCFTIENSTKMLFSHWLQCKGFWGITFVICVRITQPKRFYIVYSRPLTQIISQKVTVCLAWTFICNYPRLVGFYLWNEPRNLYINEHSACRF